MSIAVLRDVIFCRNIYNQYINLYINEKDAKRKNRLLNRDVSPKARSTIYRNIFNTKNIKNRYYILILPIISCQIFSIKTFRNKKNLHLQVNIFQRKFIKMSSSL